MLQRLLPLAALGLLPLVASYVREEPPAPLAPDRDVASLIPERSLVYVEAHGLGPFFEQGLEHPFLRSLLRTELGELLLAEAETSPEALLAFADAQMGAPLLPDLMRVAARGVGLGITGERGGARVVLVLHGDDALLLADLLDRAFDLIEQQLGIPGLLDEPQRMARGAEVWSLGEELIVARRDALLVVSNDEGLLRDALDLAADPDGRGLLARASFRRLAAQRSGDETLWGWVDLAGLEAVDAKKVAELRKLNRQPPAQALLGSGISGITTADVLSAWITIDDDDLELGLLGHDVAPAEPLLPGAGDERFAAPPPLRLEGALAEGMIYRDYAALFRHRVELFPPETLPAFSQGISTFALFFGGKDPSEDVLPHISPWLRFVARPLRYDPGREPEMPLPGLVVVAELDHPEVIGPEIVTAFQTLIAIINVDRAQKTGGPGLRLRLGLEGDVEVTSARFAAPGPEDGVDVRYNLQPACAVAGGAIVLGTHEELVRAVVRELERNDGEHDAGHARKEMLELSGAGLARVIAENLDALVMQKVLDEGVTIEEAEEEIGGLRLLLAAIDRVRVEVDYGEPGAISIRTSLGLDRTQTGGAR